MNLQNKVLILTGAARIGKAVAQALADRDARLTITYLHDPPDLKMLNTEVLFVQADLTQSTDVTRVIARTKAHYGRIDGLIHMAAIYSATPWKTLREHDWDENMNVIAKSTFLLAKAVGDHLLTNDSEGDIKGKIITISDWSVLSAPYKSYLPYNVAKTAVVGLTKSLAKELAPAITVNCIAPGPILKPAGLSEDESRKVLSKTPLARWGGAHVITEAILYLLAADFVTGQVVYVDGGRSIA
jgi:pteridine reductase